MKALQIKKSSFHYKFVGLFFTINEYTDICDYMKKLLVSLLLFTSFSVVIFYLTFSASFSILYNVLVKFDPSLDVKELKSIIGDFLSFSYFFGTVLNVIIFCGAIITFYFVYLHDKLKSIFSFEKTMKESSFVGECYNSIKNKYCVKIEVVD